MKIQANKKNYSVDVLGNLLDQPQLILSKIPHDRRFYFVDANVARIYKEKLVKFIGDDFCLEIEALEANKEYSNLAKYYQSLIDAQFSRQDLLITIGGGILQDISGFIADTLYRGIKWLFVPTTLLAQADSCIGSKTSINFGSSKNLIGTFCPPDAILIDAGFCQTLTDEYFNSGLGEVIKFHLMADSRDYDLLRRYLSSNDLRSNHYLEQMIWSTLKIKKSYFDSDEHDQGRRNLLNYGHCFGHALESASDFKVCHGEAVIVGMGFANLLSLKRGIMRQSRYAEFEAIFKKHYPKFHLADITADVLIKYLRRDKKRVGKDLTMILAQDVGRQFKFNDIKEDEIQEIYKEFLKIYPY